MTGLFMADVGDGLCVAFSTLFGQTVLIDCGSQQNPVLAYNGFLKIHNQPLGHDAFVLSHFHADHYNGLLFSAEVFPRQAPLMIREVFYPRIPDFTEKAKFAEYLFSMNLILFGAERGVMAYDFLNTMLKLNNQIPFRQTPLYQGKIIEIGGSRFEVLWPPLSISSNRKTLSNVRKALVDFEIAIAEDKESQRLHDFVREEGIFKAYLENGEESRTERQPREREHPTLKIERRKLPPIVEKANDSLKKAANDLSLAFFGDNRLLFLGDLEKHEIEKTVDYLRKEGMDGFHVFVTPHHGTHWHDSLRQIRCVWSISSNGRKMCSKMKTQFKDISKRCLCTFANGDLTISGFH